MLAWAGVATGLLLTFVLIAIPAIVDAPSSDPAGGAKQASWLANSWWKIGVGVFAFVVGVVGMAGGHR